MNSFLTSGEGANKFASEFGFEEADPDGLITPYARERLEKYKKDNKTSFNFMTE